MKKKSTLLIVENSRFFSELVSEIATDFYLESSVCSTGSEALALAAQQTYNLICVSYYLSDMTAEEFCQKIRAMDHNKSTRILLITSEESPSLLRKVMLAGATDIFDKQNIAGLSQYIQCYAETVNNNIVGQVLLVEDSPSQLAWVRELLRSKGLDVDAFSNAEEAFLSFKQHDYDVVVTDVVLEGMSGINLVRSIRRLSNYKAMIPIFAVSGYDDVARRTELYHLGVNDYMAKPLITEELLQRIANLVRQRRLLLELEREKQSLLELALIDVTTSLYNRAAFNQLAPKQLAQAEREARPLGIALMDLDLFKQVNDTHGHDVGDLVLKDVGEWLRGVLRKGDMVFRWGGEEFILLLNNCTLSNAYDVVEGLRQRFILREMGGLSITASFGVSAIESYTPAKTLEDCFKEADSAMYEAKHAGRNRVMAFKSTR